MICGKQRYPTRQDAINAARGLNTDKRTVRSRKQPDRAYFCKACECYHLATEGKNGRRRVNKEPPLFRRKPVENKVLLIHHKMQIK